MAQAEEQRDGERFARENQYEIVDAKHGRATVAGNSYDGNVYHQYPEGRANARWVIVAERLPLLSGLSIGGVFYIVDTLHWKPLVARSPTGWPPSVTHGLKPGVDNPVAVALWRITPGSRPNTCNIAYALSDGSLSIVAGDVYDGHLYLQEPAGRANADWQFRLVKGTNPPPKEIAACVVK